MDAISSSVFTGVSENKPHQREPQSLGQQDFLQLLVAQLKHQDPFEPLQNGEFIAQMAQFGTVTGIQSLENSVSSLSNSLLSDQSLQAANLIGRTIRINSQVAQIESGGSVQGVIDLPVNSQATAVNIYDVFGNLVEKINLGSSDSGMMPFVWNGKMSDGSLASSGDYVISAEFINANGENTAVQVFIDTKVTGITLGRSGNGIMLNLEGGNQTDFRNIYQIL